MFSDLKYELFRGFAYRRIEHEYQSIYTTALPLLFGVLVTVIYVIAPEKLSLLGKDGILSGLLAILATLPGFYFAGLAAVATFGGDAMDTDMPDPAPQLEIRVKGILLKTPLSRRKYMSYIFSYLVVLSFTVCGLIVFLNAVQPTIIDIQASLDVMHLGWISFGAETLTALFIFLICSSIAITTLQGLFFLSERIHQP